MISIKSFLHISQATVELLVIAGVILFGAIVHATAQLKVHKDNGKEFDRVDFTVLTLIASFSGLVFGLTASLFFENLVVIILFSAIGAFLGMAGLNRVANTLLEVLTGYLNKK